MKDLWLTAPFTFLWVVGKKGFWHNHVMAGTGTHAVRRGLKPYNAHGPEIFIILI